MAKRTVHHRSISFQGDGFFALQPQEVVLIDRHHRITEDPWQVFREKGSRIAKVVPTRKYEIERAPHHMLVRLQQGIRVHVFHHLIGKTAEDEDYDARGYFDHVHHLAYRVGTELGIGPDELEIIKSSIKKDRAKLSVQSKQVVEDIREVMKKILLVGTTNLAVTRGEGGDFTGSRPNQIGLFDGDTEGDFPEEDDEELEQLYEKQFAEEDEDGEPEFPLFDTSPLWKIQSVMWTPGSVANFLPESLPHSKESVIKSVDRTLHQFFRERLK